jgi:hypothetical protein
MIRTMKLAVCAAATLAAMAVQARADLIFDFSISNTIGNVPGTVSGQILGLADNTANQAASEVLIQSFPAGPSGLLPVPDPTVAAPTWTFALNSFTVSGGQVTAADFDAFTNVAGPSPYEISFFIDKSPNGRNMLADVNNSGPFLAVDNFGGLPGANIVPVNSATPEPASWLLLGTAIVTIGGIRVRSKTRKATGANK